MLPSVKLGPLLRMQKDQLHLYHIGGRLILKIIHFDAFLNPRNNNFMLANNNLSQQGTWPFSNLSKRTIWRISIQVRNSKNDLNMDALSIGCRN